MQASMLMAVAGAWGALIRTLNRSEMDKVFVDKVALMRKLQKQYFRDRDPLALRASKKAESEVDLLLEKYTQASCTSEQDNHPKLF